MFCASIGLTCHTFAINLVIVMEKRKKQECILRNILQYITFIGPVRTIKFLIRAVCLNGLLLSQGIKLNKVELNFLATGRYKPAN